MTRPVANLIAFQLCWLAAVLGAAAGMPWLGVLFAALWLPAHVHAAKDSASVELKLVVAAGLLGFAADSLLVLSGFMSFPPQARLGAPTTLWMVVLWLAFAATLRHVLGWLRGRYLLGALLGAVAGPFAYWSGSKLGAVVLTDSAASPTASPTASLIAVGVVWLLAMPTLLWLVAFLERNGASDPDSHAGVRQEAGW